MPEAWVMLRRRNRWYEQDYISITNLISGHESLQQKTVLKQSLEAVPGVTNAWCALWNQRAPGCLCLVALVGQAGSVSGTWLGWHSTPDPKQETHLGPSVSTHCLWTEQSACVHRYKSVIPGTEGSMIFSKSKLVMFSISMPKESVAISCKLNGLANNYHVVHLGGTDI